jgi:hypothetical protein
VVASCTCNRRGFDRNFKIYNVFTVFSSLMSYTSDPDLERMVADMSVARTPAAWQAGGVDGRENAQGTLDRGFIITGQPRNVLSAANDKDSGIPGIIDVESGQATGQAHNEKVSRSFLCPHGKKDLEPTGSS